MGGLFSGYIRHWARKKIEKSGWPSHCTTDEFKEIFVKDCKELLGIIINPSEVEKNPALRLLYKLALNTSYGKTCELAERTSTSMVSSYEQLLKLALDDTIEIQSIIALTDSVMQVNWKTVAGCVDSLPTCSVITGAYTTMYARLELYKYLALVQERAVYTDTDSILFVSKPGQPDPPLGPYLGQLTDELEGYGKGSFIYEWVSGGSKQYCAKVAVAGDVTNTVIMIRLRGISVNYSCSDLVTFDRFKDMVVHGRDPTTVDIPAHIARLPNWKIVTRRTQKLWRPCLTKRQYSERPSLPFGYHEVELDDDDLQLGDELLALLD